MPFAAPTYVSGAIPATAPPPGDGLGTPGNALDGLVVDEERMQSLRVSQDRRTALFYWLTAGVCTGMWLLTFLMGLVGWL